MHVRAKKKKNLSSTNCAQKPKYWYTYIQPKWKLIKYQAWKQQFEVTALREKKRGMGQWATKVEWKGKPMMQNRPLARRACTHLEVSCQPHTQTDTHSTPTVPPLLQLTAFQQGDTQAEWSGSTPKHNQPLWHSLWIPVSHIHTGMCFPS